MTIKLDMSKAYDKVEWDFLKEIMLGFAKGMSKFNYEMHYHSVL